MRTSIIEGNIWFNTPHPIAPEELNGKVVLVDFWTYSCVNCIRTVPFLQEIWKKYRQYDFFIIGIHTPEFEFEKSPVNVELALERFDIHWPIVLDNDYINWNHFANHYWPAKYLIDQNGYIVYEHFGEGGYRETEEKIQEELKRDFGTQEFPPLTKYEGSGGYCTIPTPERYLGFSRGFITNAGGYHEDHIGHYLLPAIIPQNSIALKGEFTAKPEYIESFGDGGEIVINFNGTEVNLVMAPVESFAVIHVELDGQDVPDDLAGEDMDKSDVVVSESRMYSLIVSSIPINGMLKIKPQESNIKAYAFTFSGCVRG